MLFDKHGVDAHVVFIVEAGLLATAISTDSPVEVTNVPDPRPDCRARQLVWEKWKVCASVPRRPCADHVEINGHWRSCFKGSNCWWMYRLRMQPWFLFTTSSLNDGRMTYRWQVVRSNFTWDDRPYCGVHLRLHHGARWEHCCRYR